MKALRAIVIALVPVVVLVIILGASAYTVDERDQVVITRFGEPVGDPVTDAGLHFRSPFIDQVNRFDKRLLRWDGSADRIPTLDKKYIWVDTSARWRISDALTFMRTVGSPRNALSRLDDLLDAAARDIISSHKLIEVVRDTNREMEATEISGDKEDTRAEVEPITFGRAKITLMILEEAAPQFEKFGIEVVDMRIKRIIYTKEVQAKVFDRMVSERNRDAEQYRSEGAGESARINGQRELELRRITSEAYRKAEEIKGGADAQAIKIYADAYGQDPEFYSFLATLDSYGKTVGSSTTLVLTTDGDYFRYIDDAGEVSAE